MNAPGLVQAGDRLVIPTWRAPTRPPATNCSIVLVGATAAASDSAGLLARREGACLSTAKSRKHPTGSSARVPLGQGSPQTSGAIFEPFPLLLTTFWKCSAAALLGLPTPPTRSHCPKSRQDPRRQYETHPPPQKQARLSRLSPVGGRVTTGRYWRHRDLLEGRFRPMTRSPGQRDRSELCTTRGPSGQNCRRGATDRARIPFGLLCPIGDQDGGAIAPLSEAGRPTRS